MHAHSNAVILFTWTDGKRESVRHQALVAIQQPSVKDRQLDGCKRSMCPSVPPCVRPCSEPTKLIPNNEVC